MSNAIETIDLSKRFNGLTAVDKLNIRVRQGEMFNLLGPNGAGKTKIISRESALILPERCAFPC